MASSIDRQAIERAVSTIAPYIRRTPIVEVKSDALNGGAPVKLKLECLQHSGSFKARGAFYNLLTREIAPAGVVTASGGNHGAAVAYAARSLGVNAKIFVPEISSVAKLDVIRALRADVIVGGANYAEAYKASTEYQQRSGASAVHAYDSVETLTGQGTVGAELSRQAADLDTLLVAVGGGGLIGGIAAWYRGDIRVVAVEPESACAYHRSRQAGHRVDVAVSGIAADSLGATRVGELMFDIGQRYIADSVLVDDAAIVSAQSWCWRHLRLAVEPGGAAALAALFVGAYRPAAGERIGVIMCGANVDLHSLAELVQTHSE